MPDAREMGEGRRGAPAAEEDFAEYLHRCARGEDVPFERVLSAHPHLADALRLLQSQAPRASPDATESPEIDSWLRDLIASPGSQKELGEYRIVRRVGRGGMERTRISRRFEPTTCGTQRRRSAAVPG